MKSSDYLRDKLLSIIFFLMAICLSAALLWLIEIRTTFIYFFELLFIAAFMISLAVDFIRKRNYYQRFWQLFDQLDDKTLFAELMEIPSFLDGKIMEQIVKSTDKYMNDKLSETTRINREYREYIEMWVHEIKTPITSAHLIIENDKNITTSRIDNELRKVERFVEQALFYARSTAVEKDFKLTPTTLRELVNTALKNYSQPIIQAGGRPQFGNLDIAVLADSKWCSFIIEQIIANAVKYKQEDLQITFQGGTYNGGSYLTVTDNGIGIAEEDLPRVFDKGFTGKNGRMQTKSTGIGLYLCKKLCEKMNMDIIAESSEHRGTTVKITFPKGDFNFTGD